MDIRYSIHPDQMKQLYTHGMRKHFLIKNLFEKDKSVRALALTDHDTLEGLAEADAAARALGIELVPGVEISVTWHGRTLHVVGLGIDPDATVLRAALSSLRAGRIERARAIGMRLAQLGIAGAHDAALRLAPSEEGLGRAHFARHLVASGHAKDMSSAFRRYLGDGKPAYVRHTWADLAGAIAWIAGAGDVAVLAHPGRCGLKRSRSRTSSSAAPNCRRTR